MVVGPHAHKSTGELAAFIDEVYFERSMQSNQSAERINDMLLS